MPDTSGSVRPDRPRLVPRTSHDGRYRRDWPSRQGASRAGRPRYRAETGSEFVPTAPSARNTTGPTLDAAAPGGLERSSPPSLRGRDTLAACAGSPCSSRSPPRWPRVVRLLLPRRSLEPVVFGVSGGNIAAPGHDRAERAGKPHRLREAAAQPPSRAKVASLSRLVQQLCRRADEPRVRHESRTSPRLHPSLRPDDHGARELRARFTKLWDTLERAVVVARLVDLDRDVLEVRVLLHGVDGHVLAVAGLLVAAVRQLRQSGSRWSLTHTHPN